MSRILETLEYGPAPESPAVANAWLDDHGRSFGHFINNQWVKPSGRKMYDSVNPATGEKLATTTQGRVYDLSLLYEVYSLLVALSPGHTHFSMLKLGGDWGRG